MMFTLTVMVNELNMTFRKLILFSALTVLLGVGVVYALSYAFTPQNSSQTLPTTQAVYDGFQLTMTLEKTVYALGEPINTTLTLTNISNQTASFGMSLGNFLDLQVYNGTNSTIYSTINDSLYLYDNWHPVVNETLNAGESLSGDLSWNQTSYPAGWQSEGVPVSSGTYYIVGQIGPLYGYYQVGQIGTTPVYEANGTIETTPIRITIAAP